MTRAELSDHILRALSRVAPEVRGRAVPPDANLREALDLDSMDLLNFAVALHHELAVDIPETDYQRLSTLDDITGYLSDRLTPGGDTAIHEDARHEPHAVGDRRGER